MGSLVYYWYSVSEPGPRRPPKQVCWEMGQSQNVDCVWVPVAGMGNKLSWLVLLENLPHSAADLQEVRGHAGSSVPQLQRSLSFEGDFPELHPLHQA